MTDSQRREDLASSPRTAERRLLIVQRSDFAGRAMSRYLAGAFDEVRVATTREQAEAFLRDADKAPTHLICGQDLGPWSDSGAALIPTWRVICPSLVCVVLATGALELPVDLPGVDVIVHKPAEPSALLQALAA